MTKIEPTLALGDQIFSIFPPKIKHIKLNCHRSDILLTNAIYRLVTPRDLPHMTPGAPLGHGQVMLGVHRLFSLHTTQIRALFLRFADARVVIEVVLGLRIILILTPLHSTFIS